MQLKNANLETRQTEVVTKIEEVRIMLEDFCKQVEGIGTTMEPSAPRGSRASTS